MSEGGSKPIQFRLTVWSKKQGHISAHVHMYAQSFQLILKAVPYTLIKCISKIMQVVHHYLLLLCFFTASRLLANSQSIPVVQPSGPFTDAPINRRHQMHKTGFTFDDVALDLKQ